MKNNKVHISEKNQTSDTSSKPMEWKDFIQDNLRLSEQLKSQLKKKGLAYKFINRVRIQREGMPSGFWRPANFQELGIDLTNDTVAGIFGHTPEGYLERGDLILAVRPLEVDAEFKRLLKERNMRMKEVNQNEANALRKELKKAGVDSEVTEDTE